MTKKEFDTIWEYYLIIEDDLAKTTRYVEPAGQENVYSFEFEKIIILTCTEIEKVIKKIAYESKKESLGNMEQYKRFFFDNYPKIIETVVRVSRLEREIKPFENWDTTKLLWWDAYTKLKHGTGDSIKEATCINAIYSMVALYVLIHYLAKITKIKFYDSNAKIIHSEYGVAVLVANHSGKLPDFK